LILVMRASRPVSGTPLTSRVRSASTALSRGPTTRRTVRSENHDSSERLARPSVRFRLPRRRAWAWVDQPWLPRGTGRELYRTLGTSARTDAARRIWSGLISIPAAQRPVQWAATITPPQPRKGSRTESPAAVSRSIRTPKISGVNDDGRPWRRRTGQLRINAGNRRGAPASRPNTKTLAMLGAYGECCGNLSQIQWAA
jgi:hypothetical protein